MPTLTPNISLKKPDVEESYNIFDVTNDNADILDDVVGVLANVPIITKEPTGFTNNENITVTYDSVTRKITLTGTFEAYYQGYKVDVLTNGWVSPAHADVEGTYFLYYNGSTFVFNTTPWTFDMLMIAVVQYNSHKIAVREVHGFMQWQSHKNLHDNIGAYRCDGGDFSNYTLSSTTPTNRRPQISITSVCDEDLKTNLPALTTNSYTQRYLTGAGTRTFNTLQPEIIANNGIIPYWNQFTGGSWQQTLMGNNEYGAIFVVAVPMTSDAGSQIYRYMFVQPQQVSTSLSTIQNLTPNNLTHGDTANLLSEFVFIGKIIIQASVTNWIIVSVEKIFGSRINQVSVSGSFLSVVTTDNSITGNGTLASPLSVVKQEEQIIVAMSDETTALTTGLAKATFRIPYACKLTTKLPRINVNTVSSSGLVTIDINKSGSTILSTKLTIDANEKTSTTATTPATLVSTPTTFTDDEEITCDIDVAGTGAKGLKLTLFVERT